ncbi:hypothetical protein Zm00014a_011920 [Zea mays]|uniref:Uncharacterized protein n=1 Tax=Zea mays TaxID=4577 RepID=A0A3L6E1C7_MAIZE|nr:hypothetical protein Zm00014a_011920 [Zea mays]
MTPSPPATVSPVSSVTPDWSMPTARVLRRTEPAGRRAASCAAMAPMPSSGRALSPRARRLNTSSKRRDDVSSAGSKNIPARNGRRNRSTMEGEKPSRAKCSPVVVSGAERMTSSGVAAARRRVSPTRTLSVRVPTGENTAERERSGRRNGSESR